MVQNFPGPWELRLSIIALAATEPLDHSQRLNVDLTATPTPGDAFNNINAKVRDGLTTPDLAAAIEAWLLLLAPRYENLTTFGVVELWAYAPLSFDATFISSYNPTLVAGTSVSATVKAAQEIYTFRTVEGGIMRINLMETKGNPGPTITYPTGAPGFDNIFDFITGGSNWILARDTSYPFASLKLNPGQNEKSFRQRFR